MLIFIYSLSANLGYLNQCVFFILHLLSPRQRLVHPERSLASQHLSMLTWNNSFILQI